MPVARAVRTVVLALALAAIAVGAACGTGDPPRVVGPGADQSLVRSDDACLQAVDSEESVLVVTAHAVVDGRLGARCFGAPDVTLVEAWDELVAISPPGRLSHLAVVMGFEAVDEADEETLAFVNALDIDGETFQMAINLPAFDDDRDEASLTLAHELTHVVTQTPDQLDRSTDGSSCATHFNGEGCYLPGSLLARWIDAFWTDDQLAAVDVDADVYPEDGEARCALDDSFFGSYAATTPEEDFAEAFSAFVYDVDPLTEGQRAKLEWLAGQPELAAFRSRASAAGLGPLDNLFEICGA